MRRVAERAFEKLGMARTRQRNAILFFVVPSRRRFAVLGDEGIHAKVGQEFWDAIATGASRAPAGNWPSISPGTRAT